MITPIRARYSVKNGRIISREFENEDIPAEAIAELFERLDYTERKKQGGDAADGKADKREAGSNCLL